ncbi:MAG: dethiobiotin synthase [Endomicrobiaceae bacterium]|nr:dethiobiotin synthase [Endomicrobiaceae bacterium]
MSKSIFITGTATDVGKTFVTGLIVKKLHDSGINAGYYKAALSGAEKINGRLIPVDAKYVCDVAGIKEKPENLVSYIYQTAVSPHLAAQIEKNPIDINKIIQDFNRLKSNYEYITVEGSGGIVCPLRIDDKIIMLTDVIKILNLDVILVVSSLLGTINSTVLTVEYAKKLNISVKAIIMNYFDKDNFMHLDNKKQIEKFTGIPVIATVSHNESNLDVDITKLKQLYKEI